MRLGINIDHVATLRNARGEIYPNPVKAALVAETAGADNITCHLREDRRHIQDSDVSKLKDNLTIPLNFEMAATVDMLVFAEKIRPHAVTLVPEKREELTTEGGLNLNIKKNFLKSFIQKLKSHNILVSLFVEADRQVIEESKELGADAVEIHTGTFCRQIAKQRSSQAQTELLTPLKQAAKVAHLCGLQVHIGHGLNYHNAHWMREISFVEEANIGHAIISQSIFTGLFDAVREMKQLLTR